MGRVGDEARMGGGLWAERQPVGSERAAWPAPGRATWRGFGSSQGRKAGKEGGEKRGAWLQSPPPQGCGACGGKRMRALQRKEGTAHSAPPGSFAPFMTLLGTRSRARSPLQALAVTYVSSGTDIRAGVPQLRPTSSPPLLRLLLLLLLLLRLLPRPPQAAPPPARPPGPGPTRK